MVLRVAVLSVCLALSLFTAIPTTFAGGPPVCPPPAYGPPPVQCGPQACAPAPCGPPNPFALCGGVLGICANICGAVIGCPSVLAGALLAPPPVFYPPVYAPAACPPPVCAPPPPMPAYRGVRKCKPVACVPASTTVACEPAISAPYPSTPCPPPATAVACGSPMPYGAEPLAGLGCLGICATAWEMPARLCSGILSLPPSPGYGYYRAGATSTFGCYW